MNVDEAEELNAPTRTAVIIGGTGQIGVASARRLATSGFSVMLLHRGAHPGSQNAHQGDPTLTELDVTVVRQDRDDTERLLEFARGADLVVDAVAYTPEHADQLTRLAGEVGSLVVISTGSVYTDAHGRSLDTATGPHDFPDFAVPLHESDPIIEADVGDAAFQTYSPLKAAMERRLLATPDLPVSILRPGAIHGPFSEALREWYFIKRVLDGRHEAVLSYDGGSQFSPIATANLAELIALCADKPGRRVLNAADDETPTVAEIGRTIFAAMNHDAEIVTFAGPPEGTLGQTPWSLPRPLLLSMDAARAELGYAPVVSYADAVAGDIRWITAAVESAAHNLEQDWQQLFPVLAERYGAANWFDYEGEDAWLKTHSAGRSTPS
ncbi:NAD-dependent epimerase/dehydratase family protein [Leifsonia sp. Root112D2]|uniref:NAD-dependent epimerase/dehydratase family protein n=1 Tax=Leifsonia sp. Root112D2 TaxID=1736426 RepID=UPI000AB936E4|nr:NAD-dependent epimerase/dehydratase family protein [Leifsonia sp. Root112D2]